jgi:DNA-binding CsgD family transcriptional regulator
MSMLADRYPELTPTELKVCALLKNGLSTKECATVLAIEPRSIEKYRQRIRRKLQLATSVNLTLYLTALE